MLSARGRARGRSQAAITSVDGIRPQAVVRCARQADVAEMIGSRAVRVPTAARSRETASADTRPTAAITPRRA
jgi:hypothetical protein